MLTIREIYDSISHDELVAENLMLSEKNEDFNEKQKAKLVVRHCIKQCGGASLMCATSGMIPIIGIGISYASIIPEELYITKSLMTMVLKIGDIYGVSPATIKYSEIISLIGLHHEDPNAKPSSSRKFSKRDAKKIITKTGTKAVDDFVAKKVSDKLLLAANKKAATKAVLSRSLAHRIIRKLPIVGIAVGSGSNILLAERVGRRSIQYFANDRSRNHRKSTKATGEAS